MQKAGTEQMPASLHRNICPALPLGLKLGICAMRKLGVNRSRDGELFAFVNLDDGQCGRYFAEGIKAATGCSCRKGTMKLLRHGKWHVILIDKKTRCAVQVAPKQEIMSNMGRSRFLEIQISLSPKQATCGDPKKPLFNQVVEADANDMADMGEVFQYERSF